MSVLSWPRLLLEKVTRLQATSSPQRVLGTNAFSFSGTVRRRLRQNYKSAHLAETKGLSQKLSGACGGPSGGGRLEAYVPRAVLASLKGRSGGRNAGAGRRDGVVLLRLHGPGA